jgi:predicted transcriptional regulator
MEESKITVRIPTDVADRMRQLAEAHDRSLNGEIVWALRQYGKQEGGAHDHQESQDSPQPHS